MADSDGKRKNFNLAIKDMDYHKGLATIYIRKDKT
jgi:hypothetical protein